jgi:hypothetical protein
MNCLKDISVFLSRERIESRLDSFAIYPPNSLSSCKLCLQVRRFDHQLLISATNNTCSLVCTCKQSIIKNLGRLAGAKECTHCLLHCPNRNRKSNFSGNCCSFNAWYFLPDEHRPTGNVAIWSISDWRFTGDNHSRRVACWLLISVLLSHLIEILSSDFYYHSRWRC